MIHLTYKHSYIPTYLHEANHFWFPIFIESHFDAIFRIQGNSIRRHLSIPCSQLHLNGKYILQKWSSKVPNLQIYLSQNGSASVLLPILGSFYEVILISWFSGEYVTWRKVGFFVSFVLEDKEKRKFVSSLKAFSDVKIFAVMVVFRGSGNKFLLKRS